MVHTACFAAEKRRAIVVAALWTHIELTAHSLMYFMGRINLITAAIIIMAVMCAVTFYNAGRLSDQP